MSGTLVFSITSPRKIRPYVSHRVSWLELWSWDLQIADPVIQCITMALKIGLRLESYLGPLKRSAGCVFSESASAKPIRAFTDVRSTESIESLALVENYIPPGEEAPIDPILASVVSSPPAYHTLALSTPFL